MTKMQNWSCDQSTELLKVMASIVASRSNALSRVLRSLCFRPFQTLPVRIYNMKKKTVTPKMYALATIIFFVILTLLLISNLTDEDASEKRRNRKEQRKANKT